MAIKVNGKLVAGLGGASGNPTVDYRVTLLATGWAENSETYTQTISIPKLTCGKAGTVPPLVTYSSNKDEYNYIFQAEATPNSGITFSANKQPTSDIDLIVIDLQ